MILAGISISALTNQGLFGRANDAKRESEIANIKEQIVLDIYEKQLEPPLGSITEEQLETILGKYGTVNKEDGTIVGITTEKGYEILLKDIYGGETVAESVPDGAIVTPVNDITTWLKTGEISKQYSYTTIEQVIADSTCTQSLMNNENAMKYLARSTEFADAICASETTMTYLGDSAYVDDTVLNSDIWVNSISSSSYFDLIFRSLIPEISSNDALQSTLGTCYASATQPTYDGTTGYSAFNVWKENITQAPYWSNYGTGDTVCRCGFKFNSVTKVYGMALYSNYNQYNLGTYKYQYSLDGDTWLDITDELPVSDAELTVTIFNKPVEAIYFVAKGVSKVSNIVISNMRIYGR